MFGLGRPPLGAGEGDEVAPDDSIPKRETVAPGLAFGAADEPLLVLAAADRLASASALRF